MKIPFGVKSILTHTAPKSRTSNSKGLLEIPLPRHNLFKAELGCF